jgi:hypothetical protein
VVWIAVGGSKIKGGTWGNKTGKSVLKAEILFKRVFGTHTAYFLYFICVIHTHVSLMSHLGSVICNSVKCNLAHELACCICVHMALPPKSE